MEVGSVKQIVVYMLCMDNIPFRVSIMMMSNKWPLRRPKTGWRETRMVDI
jgi:hypothetical protein